MQGLHGSQRRSKYSRAECRSIVCVAAKESNAELEKDTAECRKAIAEQRTFHGILRGAVEVIGSGALEGQKESQGQSRMQEKGREM